MELRIKMQILHDRMEDPPIARIYLDELWKEYVEAPHMTFFIEHTQNDNQWGDAGSGNGTNFLGKMLTALLWETRTGQTLDRIAFFYLDWLHTANVWVAEDFYRD